MKTVQEHQVTFGLTPELPNTVRVGTLLIPNAGWHYMHNGMAHDIDLTRLGIPLKLFVGRCINHDDGMRLMRQVLAGTPTIDMRGEDFSIPGLRRYPPP